MTIKRPINILHSFLFWGFLSLFGCTSATAEAAQLAPYYGPARIAVCDGTQYHDSFALDYGQAVYIRHIEMVNVGAQSGQSGTTTLSIAVPPGVPAPFIAGMGGIETSAHVDFGVNGWMVPLAQALAMEYSCAGGGTRTLLVTIGYTITAGATP